MTIEQKQAEVDAKIINLYAENIQLVPREEFEPRGGAGATEGFISKEFKTISGTRTDKRGRTIFVGTKG